MANNKLQSQIDHATKEFELHNITLIDKYDNLIRREQTETLEIKQHLQSKIEELDFQSESLTRLQQEYIILHSELCIVEYFTQIHINPESEVNKSIETHNLVILDELEELQIKFADVQSKFVAEKTLHGNTTKQIT